MGITIFASGKLSDVKKIQPLIEDIRAMAEAREWTYRVLNDDFAAEPDAFLTHADAGPAEIIGSLGLKGIIVNVDSGPEGFSILFDKDGVLTDALQHILWLESEGQHRRLTLCKTQFADIESHIAIIRILDLVKKSYIPDLKVFDEGCYWEMRNSRLLAEKRIQLGQYLRHIEKIIKRIELSDEDRHNTDAIAEKMEEALLKEYEENRRRE